MEISNQSKLSEVYEEVKRLNINWQIKLSICQLLQNIKATKTLVHDMGSQFTNHRPQAHLT